MNKWKILTHSLIALCTLQTIAIAQDSTDLKAIRAGNAANYIPGQKPVSKPLNIKIPQTLLDDVRSGQRPHLSNSEIAKLAAASTGKIEIAKYSAGKVLEGTGFFVRSNIIATNHHVIKNGISVGSKMTVGNKENSVEVALIKVIADDPVHDIALVSVVDKKNMFETKNASNIQPLPLCGLMISPQVGDSVYLLGSPGGLSNTFSTGILSAYRNLNGESVEPTNADFMQFTAPITHGSSGSPILNAKGEVIGIAWGAKSEFGELNLGAPVKYIKALLQQTKL